MLSGKWLPRDLMSVRRAPLVLLAVCAIALGLRLAVAPFSHARIESDEVGYLSDGLLMVEGVVQGYKASPSGPITWVSAAAAAGRAILNLVRPSPELAAQPLVTRPLYALEAALFEYHADMTGLRLATVLVFLPVILASVWSIFHLGRIHAGVAGGLACGLVAAALPSFVEFSAEARPYALAWALASMAIAAAFEAPDRWRSVGSGIALGLAVGTRIDMAMLAPLVVIALWRRPPTGTTLVRSIVTTACAAAIAFVVVAPWYVTHLIGNLRLIVSIRLLPQSATAASTAMDELLLSGAVIPLFVTFAGLLLAVRGQRQADWCTLAWLGLMTAMALRPSAFGIRHNGALLVAIVTLLPVAIGNIRARMPQRWVPALLVALVGVPVLALGVFQATTIATAHARDDAVHWIENNVQPGTRLFTQERLAFPLPTPAAARRLWDEVADPDAWRRKLVGPTASRFGLSSERLPLALTEEHMYLDRSLRRRPFILAAPYHPERPRYDLHIVSDGAMFDVSTESAIRMLCKEGGVFLRDGTAIDRLGAPAASWVSRTGLGSRVYVVKAGSCDGS